MQISRLQCDNSTLIKTVEMLSKQLLCQREESSNISSSESDVYKNPQHVKESDIQLPKGKKKKQRGKKKKENELPSQSGNPSHCAIDKDKNNVDSPKENEPPSQSGNRMHCAKDKDKNNVDSPNEIANKLAEKRSSTQTDNQKHVVVITGDLFVKNVVQPSMSKSVLTIITLLNRFRAQLFPTWKILSNLLAARL